MNTILELEDERRHATQCLQDMAKKVKDQKRSFTDDEKAEFDALVKKVADFKEQIAEAKDTEERLMRADSEMQDLNRPERRKTPHSDPRGPVSDSEFPTFDKRLMTFGKPQAFTPDNFGAQWRQMGYRAGMWAQAALLNRASAQRWCQNNGIEYRAMTSADNTAGGVLVPEEMEQAIIIQRQEYGEARKACRIVPMGGDTMIMPKWSAGITTYYLGQNASITASQPTLGGVELHTKKLAALIPFSSELNDDAVIDIGDFLATEIARGFAKAEDEALFNGDGTSTYGGIVGARVAISGNSALASWVEAAAAHNLITEIDIDDLLPLMAACPQYALANAAWFVSPVFYNLVFMEIMEAGGGQTFMTYEAGATRRSFLGFPCVITPSMPNVAATDYDTVTMCLFGDMRMAAYLGDRRGMTVLTSAERYMEYDQIAVRGTERYDIKVHGIGDATDAGAIVGLIGNVA